MTQACDLEQGKVRNIVLCPHLSLQEYRSLWEEAMRGKSQNPTEKAWRNHCDDIRDAYVWNLAILNTGKTQSLSIEHRIVDFHEIYTVPRNFLESFLGQRGQKRLRLLPPYREHLSQAFARFLCVSDCLLQLRKVGSCARRIWRARPALQPAFQGRESGAITSIASLRGAEGGIIRTGG